MPPSWLGTAQEQRRRAVPGGRSPKGNPETRPAAPGASSAPSVSRRATATTWWPSSCASSAARSREYACGIGSKPLRGSLTAASASRPRAWSWPARTASRCCRSRSSRRWWPMPNALATADDAAALADVVCDPVRFCRGLLCQDLWALQEDILRAVATLPRVAVKACHASGKTFVAAVAVLWFVTRYRDGIVVTTAPTWTQVEKLLWGEIHRAAQSSRIAFPQLSKTELRIGPGNYALGLSTNEGVRFQGFHGRILIVIDEAPGVKADIWESIEGIRAGGDVHVLALYAEGRRQGLKRANSLGLTSVFEANATPGVLQAYQDLDSSNELTARVVAALETKPSKASLRSPT